MSLIVGNTPGTDFRLSEDKIKGYKHFANKIWNITRFILENTDGSEGPLTDTDAALRKELDDLIADVTTDMQEYRMYLAAEKIYHYVWHRLADVILEESKPIFAGTDETARVSRKTLLRSLLRDCLIILHPFMPFVTEEIWKSAGYGEDFLMVASWPQIGRAS